jgi:hypothetical protein
MSDDHVMLLRPVLEDDPAVLEQFLTDPAMTGWFGHVGHLSHL